MEGGIWEIFQFSALQEESVMSEQKMCWVERSLLRLAGNKNRDKSRFCSMLHNHRRRRASMRRSEDKKRTLPHV